MSNWRLFLILAAIAVGRLAAGDSCHGQAPPPGPPLPYGPPSTPPASYPINSPSDYPVATNPVAVQQPLAAVERFEKRVLSTWYTRAEYFHWNERVDGADFVNEKGALYTLGYERRIGCERFRVELFGGDMNYDGGLQWDDGTYEPSTSRTRYLGCRGEYEHLIEPSWWPNATFLLGVGSRFWIRDIKAGYGDYGSWSDETQEAWWTFYPYLGLEARRPLGGDFELYSLSRVGATALTYDYSNTYNLPVYPRLGVVAGVELGIRGPRLALSGACELMSWSRSADQHFSAYDSNDNLVLWSVNQPASTMLTVGGKLSYSF